MKIKGLEKIQNENKESKLRIILMVVFNSLFNLIAKVPSMISSLNDVRLLLVFKACTIFQYPSDCYVFDSTSSSLSFKSFCMSKKTCIVSQQLGNLLFLLSISSSLHFLKRFDKNFQKAYKQAFPDKKENKNLTATK